ncbi:MAG: PD40 domain-containing protein [Deltaproteobacteria bacterium]|nr:PD40 domain-containing protein [Deltaproteobacteria bacterium]
MPRAVRLLLVLALGLCAVPVAAFHYITPPLVQIPPVGNDPGTIRNPSWGGLRYVLFDSDADLLANGSTGRQIFLFDLQTRDVQGVLALTQLTTAAADDNQRGRTGRKAVTVVYDARLGGIGARQLMLLDRHTGAHHQLTNGSGDSTNARIDDGERVVVFESAADFFGSGAGGTQIYRLDLRKALLGCPFPCAASGNAGLTQLTNKTGNNRNAVTSNSGKFIYFQSDADLLNIGQTENQIYLYDNRGQGLSIVSHGPGASRTPTVTRDGGRLVFESEADLTGLATGGTQLFLYRRNKATLRQLTTSPGGSSTSPSMSSNGHAVAFLSPDDLLNNSSVGPELYSYDLKKNVIVQVTDAPANISAPAYASGVFTVFLADGDLAGNGSPGTQLLLTNLFALAGQIVP